MILCRSDCRDGGWTCECVPGVETSIASIAAFLTGLLSALALGATLVGPVSVLGLTGTGLTKSELIYQLPPLQCALVVAGMALVWRWGRRPVLLGGLVLLILAASAWTVAGLSVVPSIAGAGSVGARVLVGCVGAAGALVLAATRPPARSNAVRQLLLDRRFATSWILWVGMYALGLWGGWRIAARLGTAGWLRSDLRVFELGSTGWQGALTDSAPAWRQAFALLALTGLVLLLVAVVLWPSDGVLTFRPSWWTVAFWTVGVAAHGLLSAAPLLWGAISVALLLALPLPGRDGRSVLGSLGVITIGMVVRLGISLSVAAIAAFWARTPLVGVEERWPLVALTWLCVLFAAVAAPWVVHDRVVKEESK